jgi:hypothetical protein
MSEQARWPQAERRAIATWSGGIDSTAVIAQLLRRGWEVTAITLDIYGREFGQRERQARANLTPILDKLARLSGGRLTVQPPSPGEFLWAFSPDGVEIPRRNKRILDHLIEKWAVPRWVPNVAMGEYTGADTWLVADHVAAHDADHRALAAYLYAEYGFPWRLISLQDFGESRYKHHRLEQGITALETIHSGRSMAMTSNCLRDLDQHCGECYKCVERAAAFRTLGAPDATTYLSEPHQHPAYPDYMAQMRGEQVGRSAREFQMGELPSAAHV